MPWYHTAIRRMIKRMFLWFAIITSLVVPPSTLVCHAQTNNKQLVVFAGPHFSGAQSVEQFFLVHASTYGQSHKAEAFDGWIWPAMRGEIVKSLNQIPKASIFRELVLSRNNPELQKEFLKQLQLQWNNEELSSKGMILGTEEFDRMGTSPWSHKSGANAIQRILDRLEISNDQVTIVLNYRTPRMEQWGSAFKHFTNSTGDHYKRFLCRAPNSKEYLKVWETLDTALDPLLTALRFRVHGWNVVLVDMSGVQKANQDISHAIACNVLKVPCDEQGWIQGLHNVSMHENHLPRDFLSISEDEKLQLDRLFQLRDCTYQQRLENDDGTQVIHKDALWNDCPDRIDREVFQNVKNTTFFFDAIRTQKQCSTSIKSLSSILSTPTQEQPNDKDDDTNDAEAEAEEKIEEDEEKEIKEEIHEEEEQQEENKHNHDNSGADQAEIEELYNDDEYIPEKGFKSKQSKQQSSTNLSGTSMEIPIFLLIAIIAGAFHIISVHRASQDIHPSDEDAKSLLTGRVNRPSNLEQESGIAMTQIPPSSSSVARRRDFDLESSRRIPMSSQI